MLALVCVAPRLAGAALHPRLCALALALAASALVAAQGARALRYQLDPARLGFGFRETRYTESVLIALARRLPAGVPIFTNSQAVAGLARMEDMRFLPAKRTPQSSRPNPDYPQQLRDMERELRERRGVIIVFAGIGDVLPNADELVRELPLRLLFAEPQGRAFALRAPAGPPPPAARP